MAATGVATSQHEFGQSWYDEAGLDMQVAEHCFTLPAANKFDEQGINPVREKCHFAAGA